MTVPKSLFTKGLDAVATQWLKSVAPANDLLIRLDVLTQQLAVAEALVVSPNLTFKVYGENVVLSLLAKVYGVKGLESLLEQKVIEFVLWNELVLRMQDEKVWQRGINPLCHGTVDSVHNRDPLVSAQMGLSRWAPWIPQQDSNRLAKLAADRTVLMPPGLAGSTVGTVMDAFARGALCELLSMPEPVPAHDLTDAQVGKLATVAEQTLDAGVMMDREADLLDEPQLWSVLLQLAKTTPLSGGGTLNAVEKVLTIEHLPSIKQLLLGSAISFEDILRIRDLPQTKEFREWLWSLSDPADAQSVGEAYLAAMTPKVDWRDKTWFKVARIAAVGVVGSAIGTLVGGPIGGAAGFALSTGGSLAVSGVDAFSLERLFSKRNPRRFATEVIRPIVAKREVASQRAASPPTPRPSPIVLTQNQRKRDRKRRRKGAR